MNILIGDILIKFNNFKHSILSYKSNGGGEDPSTSIFILKYNH